MALLLALPTASAMWTSRAWRRHDDGRAPQHKCSLGHISPVAPNFLGISMHNDIKICVFLVLSFERGTWLFNIETLKVFLLFLKNTAEAPLLCKPRTYEAVIASWIIPEKLKESKREGMEITGEPWARFNVIKEANVWWMIIFYLTY